MSELPPLTPAELEAATIKKARVDFCVFAEFVGRDEADPTKFIVCAPIHRRWANLCDEHDDLLIWAHRNAGKTSQLSVLRTLWELGRNPNLRFLILAKTSAIAVKIVRSIAQYIENSEELHRVFPKLKPDPNGPWTTTELQVMRPTIAKDPSVRAEGVRGSLASGRVDRLVVDDILDTENVRTQEARDELDNWYKDVVIGMLVTGSKRIVVGTAFHPDDQLHRWAKTPGVYVARFPLLDRNGKVTWPEQFPPYMIEKKRIDCGPLKFARQYLCIARDDGEAEFQQTWVDAALKKGEGRNFVYSLDAIPAGAHVFTGVDLAASKKKKSDETIFFTFIQYQNGIRQLLNIEAGKWNMPDILKRCRDHSERYDSDLVIETNAAQAYVFQQLKVENKVRVYSHTTTGGNKHDPTFGVLGLADELERGLWVFPNRKGKPPKELAKFIAEMLFYNPNGHTGDRLMACWFGRERARQALGSRGSARVNARVIGADRSETPVRDAEGRTELERVFDVPD